MTLESIAKADAGGVEPGATRHQPGARVRPSLRAVKKAAMRTRIVNAALELFREQGYEGTSIADITSLASVAPRTFYAYFRTKADVALAGFTDWHEALLEELANRPLEDTPDQMLRSALEAMEREGFASGRALVDADGLPVAPAGIAVVLAERAPDVAGRVFQTLTRGNRVVAQIFRDRLQLDASSIIPEILAGAMTATWFSAMYAFQRMAGEGLVPPPTDQIGLAAMDAYTRGIHTLWAPGTTTPRAPGTTPATPIAPVPD